MIYNTLQYIHVRNGSMERENRKNSLNLKELISSLPNKPGVYIMKNQEGEVIYVGKAKNLSHRVRSYFSGTRDIKTEFLIRNVETIETIITNNEYEALLLENNLIKKWKPRYNINLKDGKTYPVLKITNEEFPRVYRTRRIIFDGSLYYGPYTSANQLDTYLKLIDKLFPLRKCRGKLKKREHPCLNYYIGRCLSPCTGKITKEEYLKLVNKVKELLSGKTEELIKGLKAEMLSASKRLEFEKAAKIRDSINAIQLTVSQQNVVDFSESNRDYIGFYSKEQIASFVVFQSREGKLIGREVYNIESFTNDEDTIVQFLFQYYGKTEHRKMTSLPEIVYLPPYHELEERKEELEEFLRTSLEMKVQITFPKRGKHFQIVEMAKENAKQSVERQFERYNNLQSLEELKKTLNLRKLPHRIEGFDISHLSGEDTVASMVSFLNGLPDKPSYRHYKIKSLKGKIDDYEAIREVIARRYQRVINDNLSKPDLILIDGGKGQLNAALSILQTLGLERIDIVGLAKSEEEIYTPTADKPIRLDRNSKALRLLEHVRDESHRFANVLQKKLRKKRKTESILLKIPGVGKKTSRLLLETFESLEAISKTQADEISRRTGIKSKLAEKIIKYLSQTLKNK